MENKLKQDVPIGQNLKKYRLAAGLSQEDVAAALQLQVSVKTANLPLLEAGGFGNWI